MAFILICHFEGDKCYKQNKIGYVMELLGRGGYFAGMVWKGFSEELSI